MPQIQPSQWTKYITRTGHIRVVGVEATALVRELCQIQGLTGPGQVGFGEATVGSLLISSGHKSNESINMNARGSTLYRQALIDATPDGQVRGFLNQQPDTSVHSYGLEGHNGPWGTGVLSILYTQTALGKTPYTGSVAIATGFLDEAINDYFRDSEQLVSCVGLSVEPGENGIGGARGALVQALGGATPAELDQIRRLDAKALRELADAALDPETFGQRAAKLLGDAELDRLETKPLTPFCTCSPERIERALTLTGEDDTLEALGQDEVMTITCDFCRREYKMSAERVRALFSRDPSRLQ